jgi:hypothetical protein
MATQIRLEQSVIAQRPWWQQGADDCMSAMGMVPSQMADGIANVGVWSSANTIPSSLQNDVFPDPASSGASAEQSAESYVQYLQGGHDRAHAASEHGPSADVQGQVASGKKTATAFTSWQEMAASIQETLNVNLAQIQTLANGGAAGKSGLDIQGPSVSYTGWSQAGPMSPGQAPVQVVIWYDGAGHWGLYTAYPNAVGK